MTAPYAMAAAALAGPDAEMLDWAVETALQSLRDEVDALDPTPAGADTRRAITVLARFACFGRLHRANAPARQTDRSARTPADSIAMRGAQP